jgi:phenylpyruvate tautomerase PptA (4-oxalocrotonate tautomerase family)
MHRVRTCRTDSPTSTRRLNIPFYRFIAPTGSPTLRHKQAIAAATTAVHAEVTGAPASYVQCAFFEIAPGSLFEGDQPIDGARMIGLIRDGRPEDMRKRLISGIATAWSAVTGDAVEDLAIFIHEVPGANTFEHGEFLPETR